MSGHFWLPRQGLHDTCSSRSRSDMNKDTWEEENPPHQVRSPRTIRIRSHTTLFCFCSFKKTLGKQRAKRFQIYRAMLRFSLLNNPNLCSDPDSESGKLDIADHVEPDRTPWPTSLRSIRIRWPILSPEP
jgi:hypothetical protein